MDDESRESMEPMEEVPHFKGNFNDFTEKQNQCIRSSNIKNVAGSSANSPDVRQYHPQMANIFNLGSDASTS